MREQSRQKKDEEFKLAEEKRKQDEENERKKKAKEAAEAKRRQREQVGSKAVSAGIGVCANKGRNQFKVSKFWFALSSLKLTITRSSPPALLTPRLA